MTAADGDQILDRPAGLAQTFDRVADGYEARPPYPDEVFELIVEATGLGPGTEVLEIGPGTGQATLPMLALGARVTAIEPGAQLARRLLERTGSAPVEVIVSTFEEASIPEAAFDLVASATAYHWVDPEVGPEKCARALRDQGWLALWWTLWGHPSKPDPFHEALQPVLRAKAPHMLAGDASVRSYIGDLAGRLRRFGAPGTFGPIRHEVIEWQGEHDPIALRRLFATFSPWLALPEPLQTELLDEIERIARDDFDGLVRRPYQTVLYLAQRTPR